MRRHPLLWLTISVVCFVAAIYLWRLGDKWAKDSARPAVAPGNAASQSTASVSQLPLIKTPANLNAVMAADAVAATNRDVRLAYRLKNTDARIAELTRTPEAILLENALIDTRKPFTLQFPAQLQAAEEPGAWIVQAKGQVTPAFRNSIMAAGAQIVAYIPNNAYLVTGTKSSADVLRGAAGTQSVLAYEPYYKLKSSLLRSAVQMRPLPEDIELNVLLFPGAGEETVQAVVDAGSEVLGKTRSPFGDVVKVKPQPASLPAMARLPGVQVIEMVHERIPANDLSRVLVGVSTNSVVKDNYLGLTGSNVVVSLSDTGVDATHPDLLGRVFSALPLALVDANGHGTHVAGIIGSSGGESATVTGAIGSIMPGVDGQFRGKAPGSTLFSMFFTQPDLYLQETAARTNALISNNSWEMRGVYEYDLAAASYDAAVRDSLPTVTGSQGLSYVFAAGNHGSGSLDGVSGNAETIVSPATAKNVITVGSSEMARGITNTAFECFEGEFEPLCITNAPWEGETDSDNEVSSFSSRGNVGISIEGEKGRFKPDVVAPGTMIISTRSSQWDQESYYSKTDTNATAFSVSIFPLSLFTDGFTIPGNAISVTISAEPNVDSPEPFPDVPIYLSTTGVPTNTSGGYEFKGANRVQMPGDFRLNNGGRLYYALENTTTNFLPLNVHLTITTTNASNANDVLRGLNDALGPYYRYESGTSMAAAEVSGTLALMHEFFMRRGETNSPALMKALLINGARSLNTEIYDMSPRGDLTSQGWGLVNITNSLQSSIAGEKDLKPASMIYFDQSTTNALVTGASRTFPLTVNALADYEPIRVTLVWTDPPGNPVASVKLVNNLDLVVTNLDTGAVYFGNDIGATSDFNSPWDTNSAPVPNWDVVNNVENVYLPPFSGSNFTVTVIGKAVNVNAVTAHPNDVAQDYALVISCGDGVETNALTLGTISKVALTAPNVTVVTNMFASSTADYTGGVLSGQHAGASTPLLGTNTIGAPAGGVITLGMTNQWHFYVITNEMGFTNAAFMTFIPPTLAVPRMGATVFDTDNATRPEADIDLYVTTEAGLTNLDPAVLDRSLKSVGRLGSETIVLSNAVPGVYYIGVKAEDQQAAEYVFAGIFSRLPFSQEDALGNQTIFGFPVPQAIPDAYLNTANRIMPGQARILGFSMGPDLVRRVTVTNVITHELMGDLTGILSHGTESATLNNHTTNTPVFNQQFVYDDSGEGDLPFAHASDGPGSLLNFGGRPGAGQWIFTQSDGAVSHVGTNGFFSIYLEKQQDLEKGIIARIRPGACRMDYVRVPAEATNLTIEVTLLQGSGPIGLTLCPLDDLTGCKSTVITNGLGGSVTIDIMDNPPISEGVYAVRTCNLGTDEITVRILARIYKGGIIRQTLTTSTGSVAIKDDAVTYAYLTNLTNMRISSTDVGLVFNHPRISDLAITLISPNGTRVLLFEDRGGTSTNGMGQITSVTNAAGEVSFFMTQMKPFFTTSFDTASPGTYAPGALIEGWNVLTNRALVVQDWTERWRTNNVLVPDMATVQFDLPTTNMGEYNLTWLAGHAPYIVGTVGWWPFEGDGRDIFGGLDGQLLGGGNTTNYSMWSTGKVYNAFYGNAVRTSVRVPYAPELDVAKGGFTVEGWIKPVDLTTNVVNPDAVPLNESFESFPAGTLNLGTYANGWGVFAGTVSVYPNTLVTNAVADTGAQFISLAGVLSTNLTLVANEPYRITLSYARNPDTLPLGLFPAASVNIGGIPMATLAPVTVDPSWANPQWQSTSFVFTASSPLATIELASLTNGVLLDSIVIEAEGPAPEVAPLFEWVGTNGLPGVQFWVSGLSWADPKPGALIAAFGTNSTPVAATGTNLVTTRRWQHVAFSYDPATALARIYRNGRLAATGVVPAGVEPFTTGDLFFGYHPGSLTNVTSFRGGIDEFGLYNRALTSCEVEAIYDAGSNGKYSTNALTCPVAYEVTLKTSDRTTVLTYTNGLAWGNGPFPEINSLSFTNPVLSAVPGGPGTNLTSITIRPLTANLALDEFTLSGLVSNQISGSLQFTENTNLAVVPIKFAPTPYNVVTFPPSLVYSNTFVNAAGGVYTNGTVLPGLNVGVSDWTVAEGTVSVVSNRMLNPLNTNALVLGESTVQTALPTIPGHRYELTYSLRGPGAVSWWNGDIEPLSGRALDLLGGNHGAFLNGATNNEGGFVVQQGADTALVFPVGPYVASNPYPVVARSPRIELGDPANLRLTNALSIEGWIYPRNMQTNFTLGVGTRMQQIFFRGDARDCLDPYYLALYYHESLGKYDVVFHVEDATGDNCGVNVYSTNSVVVPDRWQHVAAVFEPGVLTPAGTRTNQMSIYLDGQLVGRRYTGIAPFENLDPAFSPGAAIGNRSRYSTLTSDSTDAQPFYGEIDDLAVYARALTEAEVAGISQRGVLGKGEPTVTPAFALSRVAVSVGNIQIDDAHGDNGKFVTRTVPFTAMGTNSLLTLRGLLPGTIIDKISLTEVPSEMNYLPEEKLNALIGENAYGVWTLEIVDTRAGGGATNGLQLVDWRLDLQMTPTYEVPVITLSHGISYQNTLLPGGVQHFVVPVPQWARYATNILMWSTNRVTGQPGQVGVLFDPVNPAPLSITNALFWPAVFSGEKTLGTNTSDPQFIVPGKSYYLTVTNPAPVPMSYEFGVLYDIPTLTNCVPQTNVANIAGIPTYYQFDVPPQAPGRAPRQAVVKLDDFGSNLTLVVSQSLPLPDLGNYDYISRLPSTNGQMIMVLTNTTPYPLQQGRWYAGVYSQQYTNVPFSIQVCYSDYTDASTNKLRIIPLTNSVPFVASFDGPFAAPPGPPEWTFYEFDLTNNASALLFELYGLTGNGDLIVQRHVPSGMAPYFDGSFKAGIAPESVTVRMSRELADLRGKWYLGVYNNETNDIGYTIRATTPDSTGLLNTALPLMLTLNAAAGPHGVTLQWNSIPGEVYIVEFSPGAFPVTWKPFPMAQPIIATTTMSAVELPLGTSVSGFYRVRHVPRDSVLVPPASVQFMPDGRVRLSWPLAYGNVTVLYSTSLSGGGWQNANLPITIEGGEYVAYDQPQGESRYYRLIAL